MRQSAVAFFVAVFLLAGWDVPPSRGQEKGTEAGGRTTIALDLMDLELPGEGSGDEMELPPIQGTESPEPAPAPSPPPRKPAEFERGKGGMPTAGRSVPAPAPGLAPFLLEEPGTAGEKTRAATEQEEGRSPEELIKELPTELKAVPPPPPRAESLKLPAGTDADASGSSGVPEIPLLKGENRGKRAVAPDGQDASLTMKPFPDLRGTPDASRDSRPHTKSRRPEDTLQVHEALDARLIDLYERYYKGR